MNAANLIASAAHVVRETGASPHPLRFLTTLSLVQLLHVGAAAAWVAGVAWVAIAFRDPARGAAAARRFRTPAVGLFAVVVITGVQNAIPHFDLGNSWSGLLGLKIAMVAVAVALAARIGLGSARAVRVEAGVLGGVAALGLVLGATVPVSAQVVVLASVPERPSAQCRQHLTGARVAARVLEGALRTFSGPGCGVAPLGAAQPPDLFETGAHAASALKRRGVATAQVVGDNRDPRFVAGVRSVLPDGDGAIFVADATTGSARAALAQLAPSARPVVLGPWLLDPKTITTARDAGVPVLIAANRDPTDQLSIDYRLAARRLGVAPTAAGLEGFVQFLAAASGRAAAKPLPGLFALSAVGVMPGDVGHAHGAQGWVPGTTLVRI